MMQPVCLVARSLRRARPTLAYAQLRSDVGGCLFVHDCCPLRKRPCVGNRSSRLLSIEFRFRLRSHASAALIVGIFTSSQQLWWSRRSTQLFRWLKLDTFRCAAQVGISAKKLLRLIRTRLLSMVSLTLVSLHRRPSEAAFLQITPSQRTPTASSAESTILLLSCSNFRQRRSNAVFSASETALHSHIGKIAMFLFTLPTAYPRWIRFPTLETVSASHASAEVSFWLSSHLNLVFGHQLRATKHCFCIANASARQSRRSTTRAERQSKVEGCASVVPHLHWKQRQWPSADSASGQRKRG